jgi:hypothetical protein
MKRDRTTLRAPILRRRARSSSVAVTSTSEEPAPAIAESTRWGGGIPAAGGAWYGRRDLASRPESRPVPTSANPPRRSGSLGLLLSAGFPTPFAEEASSDAPLKAAALAIGATVGGAGGVLVKAIIRSSVVSYGDAWILGSAAGVGVIVLYLLL